MPSRLQTPVVVVVGNESSGKSSLLDRLAMMPLLPRGENTCTRMAILLRLRRSDTPKLPFLLVRDSQSGAVLRQVTAPSSLHTGTYRYQPLHTVTCSGR